MEQLDLIETAAARSLLDQLLEDSRLYKSGADYKQLLEFVVRLRNFAPFNAMLLQIQKPGLMYAASSRDWRERFGRLINDEARPLLILWPFGPVALVYDVKDTNGLNLPEDVSPFIAHGVFDEGRLLEFESLPYKKQIRWINLDAGEGKAGSIRCVSRAAKSDQSSVYEMRINEKHEPAVKFSTVMHELAHLCLGHLGKDGNLKIPARPNLSHAQVELEAESVAYIVCQRNGIKPKSESYLSKYVGKETTTDSLDLYQIMRAAGQAETLLGLGAHTKYDKPKGGIRQ
jgi:hypothetical protein